MTRVHRARAIMVQGTMSNAGKSLIAAGLCRIFAQDGLRAVPFKSQNMALNSFVGDDGLELGRAQAMQAEAAGVAPDARMNPVLLKPTGDTGSQVIVNGRPIATLSARDYFRMRPTLTDAVESAFESLAEDADVVVIEGAGSPAEINLGADDFVNMGMARIARAPVLLVGNIDPGGVFAQLFGTISLLPPDERAMVKGLIVNRFRGDASLFADGAKLLEKVCETPVLGVVPNLAVDLDDEDSLSPRLSGAGTSGIIDIAAIRLPRLSNFTDLNELSRHPDLSVRYVGDAASLGRPDLIVIPGTKNTVADTRWLADTGLARCIKALAATGTPVIGVCGGYQILGRRIIDEVGAEGEGEAEGLGLLPMETTFAEAKELSRVRGTLDIGEGLFAPLSGMKVEGYEIHMGETHGECPPAVTLEERLAGADACPLRPADGGVAGNVWGTYLHGVFDSPGMADGLARILRESRGLDPTPAHAADRASYRAAQYDALAEGLRNSLNMELVYKILEEGL